MKEGYDLTVIEKDFESYYIKSRGLTVAAFGVDLAAQMEVAAKVAFFAGYACGMLKAEEVMKSKLPPMNYN